MATPAGHYTAILQVEHVTPEGTKEGNDYNRTLVVVPREVREVSRIVVRASTLEELVTKSTAHLSLITDIK